MDATISLDTVVVAAKDQASCRLEDEVAIVQLKEGVYYGLDPVGARIWELIATPRSLRTVRDVVLAEYEVDAERCESDLLRLVHTMMEAGLVEISDGAPR
jgi:Coenzyme PQQ synthesis protein D (PqqD)